MEISLVAIFPSLIQLKVAELVLYNPLALASAVSSKNYVVLWSRSRFQCVTRNTSVNAIALKSILVAANRRHIFPRGVFVSVALQTGICVNQME